ncbi:MAG: 30S ribosomal protein S18 [Firmicutes bacterium]|nr:30S ribosomal protein S18 [Bacillota bacterium]
MENKKPPAADAADDKVKRPKTRAPKRKVCVFCVEKPEFIDYKDVSKLKRYITEKGKIIPRRTSGTCAKHQRELAMAIKNARVMALLPFKAE